VLECVINISEGKDRALLAELGSEAGDCLLDVHTDEYHHRSVFTLAGDDVLIATKSLVYKGSGATRPPPASRSPSTARGCRRVPFVPIGRSDRTRYGTRRRTRGARPIRRVRRGQARDSPVPLWPRAIASRDSSAAFVDLAPDLGPRSPSQKTGAVCVGARLPLNRLQPRARGRRPFPRQTDCTNNPLGLGPSARALGRQRSAGSCNLVEPWRFGPAECTTPSLLGHGAGHGARGPDPLRGAARHRRAALATARPGFGPHGRAPLEFGYSSEPPLGSGEIPRLCWTRARRTLRRSRSLIPPQMPNFSRWQWRIRGSPNARHIRDRLPSPHASTSLVPKRTDPDRRPLQLARDCHPSLTST